MTAPTVPRVWLFWPAFSLEVWQLYTSKVQASNQTKVHSIFLSPLLPESATQYPQEAELGGRWLGSAWTPAGRSRAARLRSRYGNWQPGCGGQQFSLDVRYTSLAWMYGAPVWLGNAAIRNQHGPNILLTWKGRRGRTARTGVYVRTVWGGSLDGPGLLLTSPLLTTYIS